MSGKVPDSWLRSIIERLGVDAAVVVTFSRPRPGYPVGFEITAAAAAPADAEAVADWTENLEVELDTNTGMLRAPELLPRAGKEET